MQVPLGDTYNAKFTTRQFTTGAPFALAGTPSMEIYEDGTTTPITAGITLTTGFNSRAGLNNVAIVATGANGFEAGKYYALVIAAGTVDGVSVVGEVVDRFRVVEAENTAGRAVVESAVVADKTGYSLTQAFPANFDDLSISASTGRVDVGSIAGTAQTAGGDVGVTAAEWATGGRLDTVLAARASQASVTALNDISAATVKAQIDQAVKSDTSSEPAQGAPPLSASMQRKIDYIYTGLVRNKRVTDTNTANEHQVFADDGSTILWKFTLSNVGNVTTQEKAATGA